MLIDQKLKVIIGPVRQALKNGWQVELYAWEDSLSELSRFFFIS